MMPGLYEAMMFKLASVWFGRMIPGLYEVIQYTLFFL